VLTLADQRKEEYLEQLFKILRQKSISSQNDGVKECAELIKDYIEEIGIDTRIIESKGNPIIYGEIVSDPSKFTLLLYGHYDVQPVDPIEEWNTPPFEPTIKNGKIYCRGVGDNKGQMMAHLFAIKTFIDTQGELPINIKMVFEGEEESSSSHLPQFVESNKDLLKADLVYTSDGPMHESGLPIVLLGVRGILYIEMLATGAKWDNHSGNKGNIVPNPAWKLMDLLKTMRDEKNNILIDGFYDDLLPPTEKEESLLKQIPYDHAQVGKEIGYENLNMDAETYYRKLMFEPTFNIAGFTSGYGGEGSKTIIPSTAKVKIDFRLVLDQNPDDIYEKVVKHVKKHDPDIVVSRLGSMEPSRTSYDIEWIKVVEKAVAANYNVKPIIQPSLGGSLPDYVWTKILQAPSVIIPYANFDESNHSPNENMNLENFYNGINCTCHVIDSLGKIKSQSIKGGTNNETQKV
jgi:acetylornithine deacetylase/succinyl-diaminopimelate desuccinylase-like protein